MNYCKDCKYVERFMGAIVNHLPYCYAPTFAQKFPVSPVTCTSARSIVFANHERSFGVPCPAFEQYEPATVMERLYQLVGRGK